MCSFIFLSRLIQVINVALYVLKCLVFVLSLSSSGGLWLVKFGNDLAHEVGVVNLRYFSLLPLYSTRPVLMAGPFGHWTALLLTRKNKRLMLLYQFISELCCNYNSMLDGLYICVFPHDTVHILLLLHCNYQSLTK